jgi:trimethylamine---corrinoid protein Co-methyltransferase
VFRNDMPRYDILSEDAMAVLDRGWRRLLSDIGVEFLHEGALDLFRAAGQRVEGSVVRFDPEWVLECVASAPGEFDLVARNPERTVHLGGRHMVFSPTQGPPFVREGEERREATMADFENLCRLSQAFDQLDTPGGLCCEPGDRPLDSRHLDMLLAVQTLTDKPYMGAVITEGAARDTIRMTEILFGGPSDDEVRVFGVVNANSPMRYDTRMIEAMMVYSAAGQAVIITPFLLMGAMSPASVPGSLVQQTAEALAGLTLTQLVRRGAPVVLGSFLSHTDMQSGSPGFGGPESAMGLLCSGQMARRLGLPWRAGGGFLTSSQTADAQAAYEGLNTMLPAFLAGANFIEHAAGWLESGLVACYEKFIVDIEMLRMLQEEFTPLEIDEASLAYGAHQEVGHGGHFLGAAHTLERFRTCFYRPLLSSTENFERWKSKGGRDATERAGEIWRETLAAYQPPPMDAGLRAELSDYAGRRRAELGD